MKNKTNLFLYEELKRIDERETFIPKIKDKGIRNYE